MRGELPESVKKFAERNAPPIQPSRAMRRKAARDARTASRTRARKRDQLHRL